MAARLRATSRPSRQSTGRLGEELAARLLVSSGMRIVARNWRCRSGEVDIVASDGEAIVVCEVKTRREGGYQHPMAAVGPAKAARLRVLAEEWISRRGGPPPGGVRIDVVGVLLRPGRAPLLEHVKGVA
ncbi:YraN family protein [Streptomyces sp. NPDC059740]|uniref:YraN family protein n=1 Tax=Streptomyces sp. NPDC059740 TaxID=3346926 RepID=UPI0036676DE9